MRDILRNREGVGGRSIFFVTNPRTMASVEHMTTTWKQEEGKGKRRWWIAGDTKQQTKHWLLTSNGLEPSVSFSFMSKASSVAAVKTMIKQTVKLVRQKHAQGNGPLHPPDTKTQSKRSQCNRSSIKRSNTVVNTNRNWECVILSSLEVSDEPCCSSCKLWRNGGPT